MDRETFRALVKHHEGGDSYNLGWGKTDLSNAPLNEFGFPIWAGKPGPQGNSRAAGAYQFQPGTWETYAKPLGITDFSPESQDKVFDAAYAAEGGKPWLPYNPDLRDAYNRALAGNTKMLPFGNARFASQMMPADPLGRQIVSGQAPMLFGDQPTGGPVAPGGPGDVNTLDPILAKLQGGTGGVGDVLAQYKQLASQGGMNVSATLARMASGFLGGKGPAQSLAGGFGGLAEGQEKSDAGLTDLLKYSMLYGPAMQQKREQALLTAATSQVARGKSPPGQIFRMYGLPPEAGKTYDEMDKEWMQTQPLPATAQKAVQTHVDEIGKLGQLQQQFVTTAKQLENGEFHVDPASQAKYALILRDFTGIWQSNDPKTYAEAQKYNSWTQTRALAREVVANAQKGALSDARSKAALEAITGGAGSLDDKALQAHLNLLANNTALDMNRRKQDVETTYKAAGRRPPDDFWSSQNLPEAPLSAKPVEEIYKDPYGKHYTSDPKQAPATAAPTIIYGRNGEKLQLSPDGKSWVPIQ